MTNKPTRHRLTDLETIEAYYFSKEEVILSAKQETIREALREIRALEIAEAYTAVEVIEFLTTNYQIKDATAWKWRTYCHKLFGRIEAADKDFERAKWRKRSEELWRQANEKDEDGRYIMKPSERAKFIKLSEEIASKINAFDKEDVQMSILEKIEPPAVLLISDSASDDLIDQQIKTGRVRYSDFLKEEAEEAEYDDNEK